MNTSLRQNALRLSAFSLTILATGTCLAQVTYHVTELPPAAGFSSSNGISINDFGEAVGTSDGAVPSFSTVGTLWRAGAAINLGRVAKGNYSSAEAINNAGVIAGEGDGGDFRPQAVIFQGGVAKMIDSGSNNARGIFVAESGFIVGNYLKGFGPYAWNPVIWTPDPKKAGQYKRLFLPHFVDPTGQGTTNYAYGGNNAGEVVGQVSSSLWSARGGLWNKDAGHSLTLLSPLPGEWDSYAYAINDLGVTVGVSDVGTFSTTPVIWSAGASHSVQPLPLLPGENSGYAMSINNSGQIIGNHGSASTPCIWVNGSLVDLQGSLDSSGAGWTLGSAVKINNLGQIVGTGTFNGQTRGFILTPVGP